MIGKKRFSLPWPFRILAWVLCVGLTGTSVFFVWAYGISFGNDKTYQWLASVIFSIFFDILVKEPVKVVVVSLCLSAYCKGVDLDTNDADQDETAPLVYPSSKWRGHGDNKKMKKNSRNLTISEEQLDIAKQHRVKVWILLRFLIIFVFCKKTSTKKTKATTTTTP